MSRPRASACAGGSARSARPIAWNRSRSIFTRRSAAAYRELAEREPYRVCLIDAARSISEIEEEIWQTISARFVNLARLTNTPRLRRHA